MEVSTERPAWRSPESPPTVASHASAAVQTWSLLRAIALSAHRRRLALLAAGAVVVICANAVGQIRLNVWQRDFYDALEQRDLAIFWEQLLVFGIIVAGLLALVVAQTCLREMINVRLREWLTHDLLDEWLAPKRAYFIGFVGQIGVNPDQRIHQDAQHLTELTTVLAIGLLQSSLLLVSFVGVLWVLSEQVVFGFGEHRFAIPGYMVWCALAYAVGGSLIAWRVGRPLIPLNAERYAREADLRFTLVRVNEHADGIALYGGEPDERVILDRAVERVVALMRRLAYGLARLTWVTSGYGWLAMIVPILVAAPGYFGGDLSFGGLMMVVGAFNQVQSSLRWFVDNFSQIADWRATLLRVVSFRDALQQIETLGEDAGRIAMTDHPDGNLLLKDVSVILADKGRAVLVPPRVEVEPGEHVLIIGEPGSGKSTMFRAMAGLWPWGGGTIQLPPREATMSMPQRPYLPLGTLRAVISYPSAPDRFPDETVRAALERVELGHLAASLDVEQRWDKELALDEQQRLAFVRVLLHAPHWVMLDDATGALNERQRDLVLSIFQRELADAAVISIGPGPAHDGFYDRTLEVVRRPGGEPLRLRRPPPKSAAAAAAPTSP